MRTELKSQNISEKFGELREKEEGALICYVMAGDPSIEVSSGIVKALARGGQI